MNKKYISDLTLKEYKLYNTLAKLRSQGKITKEQFDYKLKQLLTKGEWKWITLDQYYDYI